MREDEVRKRQTLKRPDKILSRPSEVLCALQEKKQWGRCGAEREAIGLLCRLVLKCLFPSCLFVRWKPGLESLVMSSASAEFGKKDW